MNYFNYSELKDKKHLKTYYRFNQKTFSLFYELKPVFSAEIPAAWKTDFLRLFAEDKNIIPALTSFAEECD